MKKLSLFMTICLCLGLSLPNAFAEDTSSNPLEETLDERGPRNGRGGRGRIGNRRPGNRGGGNGRIGNRRPGNRNPGRIGNRRPGRRNPGRVGNRRPGRRGPGWGHRRPGRRGPGWGHRRPGRRGPGWGHRRPGRRIGYGLRRCVADLVDYSGYSYASYVGTAYRRPAACREALRKCRNERNYYGYYNDRCVVRY